MKKLLTLALGLLAIPSKSYIVYDRDFMAEMTSMNPWKSTKSLFCKSYAHKRKKLFQKINDQENIFKCAFNRDHIVSLDGFILLNGSMEEDQDWMEEWSKIEEVIEMRVEEWSFQDLEENKKKILDILYSIEKFITNYYNDKMRPGRDVKKRDKDKKVFAHLNLAKNIIESFEKAINNKQGKFEFCNV